MSKVPQKTNRYFEREERKEFDLDSSRLREENSISKDDSSASKSSSFEDVQASGRSDRNKMGFHPEQAEEDNQALILDIISGFFNKGKITKSPVEINLPKHRMREILKYLDVLTENTLTRSKMDAFLNHFLNKQSEEGATEETKGRLFEALVSHATRKVMQKEEKLLALKIGQKMIGFEFSSSIKKSIFSSNPLFPFDKSPNPRHYKKNKQKPGQSSKKGKTRTSLGLSLPLGQMFRSHNFRALVSATCPGCQIQAS